MAGAKTTYQDGSIVLFNYGSDTAEVPVAPQSITITENIVTPTIVFDNKGTIMIDNEGAGALSGNVTMYKENTGDVIFNSSNAAMGGTIYLNDGALFLGADNALGTAGVTEDK